MKKIFIIVFMAGIQINSYSQNTTKSSPPTNSKDSLIGKKVKGKTTKTVVKTKPAIIPKVVETPKPIVIPTPEFINQPYYYNQEDNRLIKLENSIALMNTKKKSLGIKGAKQVLSMEAASSKVRFTAKNNITFIIKTSGDVIDLTSYIKLYKFIPTGQKREVTISSKEGLISNKEEEQGKLIPFSVKMISPDNYMIQLSDTFEAGEYAFVWVKNMELKEFNVFAFGIDWKSSD